MSSSSLILLIDDNPEVARALKIAFDVAGHRIEHASGPEEAYSRLAATRFDAILLDLNFSAGQTTGEEGLACLERILADDPAACVLVITAHSGIRIAVAAMQAGARDFVMKPWRNAELVAKVEASIARRSPRLPESPPTVAGNSPALLLGESSAIERVRQLVRRLGPTAADVAITGPSGSGRRLVAHALHAASAAADVPLTTVDARDPEQWARMSEAAGTVVLRFPDQLDEISQSRLLERLPETLRSLAIIDNLHALTSSLRRRIATVQIAVPPLTSRSGDALLLARHFARMAAARHGLPIPQMTPAAERIVVETRWEDEVRGLASAVERAVLLAADGLIDAAALTPLVSVSVDTTASAPAFDLSGNERAIIAAALREHHHNVSHAATALGLSRGALYRRMERYGL